MLSPVILDEGQIESCQAQGYTLVENALSAQQLAQLQGITEDYLQQSRKVTESDAVFDLDTGRSAANPRLESVPVRMPMPPAPDGGSIFKVQQSGGAVDAFA